MASGHDLKRDQNNIIFSIKQAYFNVLRQESAVRSVQETLLNYEKQLEQIKGFVDVGIRIKYDITKAEVNIGNTKLQLISARNKLFLNRQILNNALGLAEDPNYSLEPMPPNLSESEINDSRLNDLVSLAQIHNPELKAQEIRVKSASTGIDIAIAALYPLSIAGSYSFTGNDFDGSRCFHLGLCNQQRQLYK